MFDAGILNDFGGGNVEWWHNYIRSLLNLADEHYQDEIVRYEEESRCQTERIAELKKAVRTYGRHHPSCKKPFESINPTWLQECTCGFEKVLQALKGE